MAKQAPQAGLNIKASFIKSSARNEECPDLHVPEYAFIGRSNVGKSSLINRLVGNKYLAKISGRPGKTQLINHFSIEDGQWALVDLPGYGYAKVSKIQRTEFSRMIAYYLRNRKNLVNVFVLVDGRHEPQKLDLAFVKKLGNWGIPFSIVFTKMDKLSNSDSGKNQALMNSTLLKEWENLPPMFLTSAESGLGRSDLLAYINKLNGEIGPHLKKTS
ncbi:MAG: YihA family ribosome biogenesis GTP-binding protein [Bacteroidetes bacterium]|nr:YihA family ribosome biogenesis GTP-binding protein [Bacteroidota bacterium]